MHLEGLRVLERLVTSSKATFIRAPVLDQVDGDDCRLWRLLLLADLLLLLCTCIECLKLVEGHISGLASTQSSLIRHIQSVFLLLLHQFLLGL